MRWHQPRGTNKQITWFSFYVFQPQAFSITANLRRKMVSGVLEFRQPHAGSEATGVPANQRRESPAARFRQNGKRDMNPTKVVIVGAGFDGLATAKALWKTPAKVLLIDGTNACEPRQFAIHEVRR